MDAEERIKQLEDTIAALREDLIHDDLTGLKTRNYFSEEVKIFFDPSSGRQGNLRKELFSFPSVSLIFFDIDLFKNVNDKYGHMVGDEVLKRISQEILDCVREGDTVARWGGEEIVVSLIGATEEEAVRKAEEIRKKISEVTFPAEPGLHVTVSAGVAEAEPGKTLEETLEMADKALYEAKETGRNKVVYYSGLE